MSQFALFKQWGIASIPDKVGFLTLPLSAKILVFITSDAVKDNVDVIMDDFVASWSVGGSKPGAAKLVSRLAMNWIGWIAVCKP